MDKSTAGDKSTALHGSELDRIFLLSHMRANTSLISHILGSHPEISGYYEMHISYRNEQDLLTQQQRYLTTDKIKTSSKYLFDKILHDEYEFLARQLRAHRIKILVSARPAEQSIKSIIRLFRHKPGNHPYSDPQQATDYYIKRITSLAQFCQQNSQRYYYYDADLIRSAAKKTLARIQQWLELNSALSMEYQLFSRTGQAGAGDTSVNITTGKIIQKQTRYDTVKLPGHLISQAESALEHCRPIMLAHAIDAVTTDTDS